MEWYLKAFKNYAVFNGRASRKEFWMFVLFNMIFAFIAVILDSILGSSDNNTGYGIFSSLYTLAIILPSFSAEVRRLHDIGKSGWWIFISFVPLIGSIWLLVLLSQEGNQGENQYGADPKESYNVQI
jgi:uncharacterized membrane protein YhaH (DUF805 family)